VELLKLLSQKGDTFVPCSTQGDVDQTAALSHEYKLHSFLESHNRLYRWIVTAIVFLHFVKRLRIHLSLLINFIRLKSSHRHRSPVFKLQRICAKVVGFICVKHIVLQIRFTLRSRRISCHVRLSLLEPVGLRFRQDSVEGRKNRWKAIDVSIHREDRLSSVSQDHVMSFSREEIIKFMLFFFIFDKWSESVLLEWACSRSGRRLWHRVRRCLFRSNPFWLDKRVELQLVDVLISQCGSCFQTSAKVHCRI